VGGKPFERRTRRMRRVKQDTGRRLLTITSDYLATWLFKTFHDLSRPVFRKKRTMHQRTKAKGRHHTAPDGTWLQGGVSGNRGAGAKGGKGNGEWRWKLYQNLTVFLPFLRNRWSSSQWTSPEPARGGLKRNNVTMPYLPSVYEFQTVTFDPMLRFKKWVLTRVHRACYVVTFG